MKRTLLRNIFTDDSKMNDKKFKSVENQVELVEKHLPMLKCKVSEYSNRKSEEKKCFDKIVTLLTSYSHSETGSLSFCIEEFARILNQIKQHLEVFLAGLESNVIEDLAEFKARSKHLRNDLKTAVAAADQEAVRQRQLKRLELLRDQEHEKISAAEADLLKAKAENLKATKAMEQHADIFEQKKLLGLRSALLSWTTLELRYHAKALELFTDAYRAAAQIDVDTSLLEFRSKMQPTDPPPRLSTVQETSRHHLQSREHMESFLRDTSMPWQDLSTTRPNRRESCTPSTVGYLDSSN